MPTMPGKTALLELLKQEGVRVMFGNPGTTELPLMDALAAEKELRYVLALQEAPAMCMQGDSVLTFRLHFWASGARRTRF